MLRVKCFPAVGEEFHYNIFILQYW